MPAKPRQRVLETAYALFQRHGVHQVGVDRIVAESGVAKTTLYRHFPSKDDLAVATLQHHDEVWTRGWLAAETERRAATPRGRLLALFDAFGAWFESPDFNGCFLMNSLLETRGGNVAHNTAQAAILDVRAFISELAVAAGATDPEALAFELHLLLMGSVTAAVSGYQQPALQARHAAEALLEEHGIPT